MKQSPDASDFGGMTVNERLNSKIATVQKRACGYRNPDHFKIAVYFHCGGLNLYPAL